MAMHKLKGIGAIGALVMALTATACGGDGGDSGSSLPQGSEPVDLNPDDFTTEIDNPYWPMEPGSRWVYRETEGGSELRVEVTVTDRTKLIANGVEARVVRDVVSEKGEPIEITDDWYAQDSKGTIWYMGEDTAEYENGKVVSRSGSFEAGVDGAEAGVIMPGDPQVRQSYRQEYLAGKAEDSGEVLSLDAKAKVPFGSFEDVLRTKDVNPLENPPEVESKYYAEGVGPVLATTLSGGGGGEELLSYSEGK